MFWSPILLAITELEFSDNGYVLLIAIYVENYGQSNLLGQSAFFQNGFTVICELMTYNDLVLSLIIFGDI